MKYFVSSTVATLCVFGATGAYYVSEASNEQEAPSIEASIEIEERITQKMTSITEPGVFLPYMECELSSEGELTDEKIESHIVDCMKNPHSWQPVQSYAN